MNPKDLVLEREAETFNAEDLIELFRGQRLAIRLPLFCPEATCDLMARRLLSHNKLEYYPHAPDIGRVMAAFYEGHSDPVKREKYYDGVPDAAHEFRKLSFPHLNPLDHLRLLLEDMWPAGAVRENIHGKPMAFGLAQIFKQGACAHPHQDFLRMDEPGNARARSLVTQVTAIVYIQPAELGGKLELWHEHFNHDEFTVRRNTNTYGLNRALIPPPAVTIEPNVGDLVLADSTKAHAVTTVEQGIRVAVNCFVGFRGVDLPLTYWS